VSLEANYDTTGLSQYPQIPVNSFPDSIYTSPANLHILEKNLERKYLLFDQNSNVIDTINCISQCLTNYSFTGDIDVLYLKTLDIYDFEYPLISITPKRQFFESSLIDSMIVLNNPIIQFTEDQITGCGPLVVTVTNQTQFANVYNWNLGDGNTSFDINPVHTYQPSTVDTLFYDLNLSATSPYGCVTQSDTTLITVLPKPVAGFTTDVTAGCAPMAVNFTNISQVDTVGSLHLWIHNGLNIDSSFSKIETYENIDTVISTPDNKEFINWLNIIKTYQEIRKSLIYLPWTVRFSELGIEKVHKLLDNNFYIITNPRTMITENLSIQLSEFTWFARFRYNRALVEALKLHANNRQWHSDIKCWSFTALDQSKIDELCNKLSDSAGIFPSLLDTCQLQFSRNRVIWKAWTEF